MDGTDHGGDIIPKAVATYISTEQMTDHSNPNHLFPCLLANCDTDPDMNSSTSSGGCSTSTAFFQSQQVYIEFEKPIGWVGDVFVLSVW